MAVWVAEKTGRLRGGGESPVWPSILYRFPYHGAGKVKDDRPNVLRPYA